LIEKGRDCLPSTWPPGKNCVEEACQTYKTAFHIKNGCFDNNVFFRQWVFYSFIPSLTKEPWFYIRHQPKKKEIGI
jgi:hypothetical protein